MYVEEDTILDHVLQGDIDAAVEIPTERVQDLSPPLTTQKELSATIS